MTGHRHAGPADELSQLGAESVLYAPSMPYPGRLVHRYRVSGFSALLRPCVHRKAHFH